MSESGRKAHRRTEKEARRRNRQDRRGRRVAASVAALATVAAVGVGQAAGPASAIPLGEPWDTIATINGTKDTAGSVLDETLVGGLVNNEAAQALLKAWRIQACGSGGQTGGADCSWSSGTGVAVVLPDDLELVPDPLYGAAQSGLNPLINLAQLLGVPGVTTIPNAPGTSGTARVIGDGFQFALAGRGGKATAISFLPVSLATAGATDNRTAIAFALVGMANAWTTDDTPITVLGADTGLDIPGIKHVSCYGGLTGAYAEGVGACGNVLGTLDFRWDATTNETQFGLTDPTAMLFDPAGVFGNLIKAILTNALTDGEDLPLTLSKDFMRLTVGGDRTDANGLPVFLTLTSNYGPTGPISVDWLGANLQLNPTVEVNGETKPNYLGLPVLTLGALDSGEIIPIIHIPDMKFPFGIPDSDATTVPGATTTNAARTLSVPDGEAPAQAARMAVPVAETTDGTQADDATDSATDGTEYVGKHRQTYVGKHRAEEAPAPEAAADNETETATDTSTDTESATDTDTSTESDGDDGGATESADSGGSNTDGGSDEGSDSGSGSDNGSGSGSGSDGGDSGSDGGSGGGDSE